MMTERCWDYLDIEPTADTAAIKKAYAKQLKFNKPDKNPQGFRDLRAAYEQALNESYWYLEEEDEDEDEDSHPEELLFTVIKNTPDVPSHYDSNDHDDDVTAGAAYHGLPEETPFAIADAAPDSPSHYDSNNHDDDVTAGAAYHGFPEETPFAIADAAPHSPSQYASNDDYEAEDSEGYRDVPEDIPFTDEDSLESSLENDHSISAFVDDESVWVASWEQTVSDEDAMIDGGDQRLLELLQAQVAEPRPLDEQNDFEEALLMWLADKPPLFSLSYQWAREYYQWEGRLTHWSYGHYPWYMIEPLDGRYQQMSYFQSPVAFRQFLMLRYPVVCMYCPETRPEDSHSDDIKRIKRFGFFKSLFFPIHVINLAYELSTLNAELAYYSQDEMAYNDELGASSSRDGKIFNAQYWQQNAALAQLNNWVFKRFIEFEDFGVIALGAAVSIAVLSFAFPSLWQNIYHDGLGVFITIALYYLFWQLMLRLFATPDTLVLQQQSWITGWHIASIVLFVMGYVMWMDIASLDAIAVFASPVYYLTHIVGLSLFIASSLRSSNFVLKAIAWHAGILLLLVAVIVPLLMMTVTPRLSTAIGTSPTTPLLWLFLAVPIVFFNLSESHAKLAWLAKIGDVFVKLWMYLMIIGAIMLFAHCIDTLPEINFGFTATAIMLVTVIMAISLSKTINAIEA